MISPLLLRFICMFSVIVAWKVQAQNPPCYLCGGNPSATMANPDFVLDLTFFGEIFPVPTATCAQILQGGLAGLLTADQCALTQIDPRGIQIQIQCGCSTVSAGTAPPVPVATPTATSAPVSVTAAPVTVTAAPVSVPTAPVSVTAAPITVTASPLSSSVRRPRNSSQGQPSSSDFLTSAEKPIPRPRAPRAEKPIPRPRAPRKRPVQMMMTTPRN